MRDISRKRSLGYLLNDPKFQKLDNMTLDELRLVYKKFVDRHSCLIYDLIPFIKNKTANEYGERSLKILDTDYEMQMFDRKNADGEIEHFDFKHSNVPTDKVCVFKFLIQEV